MRPCRAALLTLVTTSYARPWPHAVQNLDWPRSSLVAPNEQKLSYTNGTKKATTPGVYDNPGTGAQAAPPSGQVSDSGIKVTIEVVNTFEDSVGPVYAWITGIKNDVNQGPTWVMPDQSSQWFYPTNPKNDTPQALGDGGTTRLKLGSKGGDSLKIPLPESIYSGRIWFSIGQRLDLMTVSTAEDFSTFGMVFPNIANPTDTAGNLTWGFAEFSITDATYANPSQVDFTAIPIGVKIDNGTKALTAGVKQDAVTEICNGLTRKAPEGWDKLCMMNPTGKVDRVLSPKTYLAMWTNGTAPAWFPNPKGSPLMTYFDKTVNAVYKHWQAKPPTFNTSIGMFPCKVANSTLDCGPGDMKFAKPSTANIFACADGSLSNGGSAGHLAIIPILCAGFIRGTLTLASTHPVTDQSKYYQQNHDPDIKFDWYSKLVHEASTGTSGYTFAYDDVDETSAGALRMGGDGTLTFIVGGS